MWERYKIILLNILICMFLLTNYEIVRTAGVKYYWPWRLENRQL